MMNWLDQTTILVKVENKYLPRIKREIEKEYRAALALVRIGGEDYAKGKVLDAGIDVELIAIITAMYKDAGGKMARIAYRETLREYPVPRRQEKALMGIGLGWLNSILDALSKFALIFVTDISRTTRKQIIDMLDKSMEQGWSYEKLAQEMTESGLALKRARVIARTEAHRGGMMGSIEGARSLPYIAVKEWVSGHDNRVRHRPEDRFDHRELDGQKVDLEANFRNEEEIFMPGDPNASPGNSIQCRCTLNYHPKLINGKIQLK